jgi:hypothetical protein
MDRKSQTLHAKNTDQAHFYLDNLGFLQSSRGKGTASILKKKFSPASKTGTFTAFKASSFSAAFWVKKSNSLRSCGLTLLRQYAPSLGKITKLRSFL